MARFGQRFLLDYPPGDEIPDLSAADRWILARAQTLIKRVTACMRSSDYAAAKSEIESFFWTELADNYLEMAKMRLYDEAHPARAGARYTLYHALLVTLKLLALFVPHVTERIYQELYAADEGQTSIHISSWPVPDQRLQDRSWEQTGDALVAIATAVRRFKSEHSLPLSTELAQLQITATEPTLYAKLQAATADLASITRTQQIEIHKTELNAGRDGIQIQDDLTIHISR